MRIVGLIVGIVVVVLTVSSVFTTLVVPRSTSSRLLRIVTRGLAKLARPVVRSLRRYETADRILSLIGPLAMVLVFVVWLSGLVIGFGLMIWWRAGVPMATALDVSGSSVFTLGIVSVAAPGGEAIEIVTSATGLLVVALEIAYLPALYTAFAARETEVTLLATRAGVPAWGPEILARHHRFLHASELPGLFDTWERWSAAVAESHANYPSLMWFRSPAPLRSWLSGMHAMLDAASLYDAVSPNTAPRQSRLVIQMGTASLRALCRALHIEFDPDPSPVAPIRLSYDEFLEGIGRLEEVGFPMERSPEEAWPHFKGWRVNYEAMVDSLTTEIIPPPAPWMIQRTWLGEVMLPRARNRTPDNPDA